MTGGQCLWSQLVVVVPGSFVYLSMPVDTPCHAIEQDIDIIGLTKPVLVQHSSNERRHFPRKLLKSSKRQVTTYMSRTYQRHSERMKTSDTCWIFLKFFIKNFVQPFWRWILSSVPTLHGQDELRNFGQKGFQVICVIHVDIVIHVDLVLPNESDEFSNVTSYASLLPWLQNAPKGHIVVAGNPEPGSSTNCTNRTNPVSRFLVFRFDLFSGLLS